MNFVSRCNDTTSKTTTKGRIKKKNLFKIDKYLKAKEMLELLKEKIVGLVPVEKVEDDSFDYLTSWQIVSAVVCYLYCELLECFIHSYSTSSFSPSSSSSSSASSSSSSSSHSTSKSDTINLQHNSTCNHNNNNNINNSEINQGNTEEFNTKNNETNNIENFLLECFDGFYDMLEIMFEVLVVRIRYTNPKQIREYFSLLSQICQIVTKIEKKKIVRVILNSKSVNNNNSQRNREKCSNMILELARIVRDSGVCVLYL